MNEFDQPTEDQKEPDGARQDGLKQAEAVKWVSRLSLAGAAVGGLAVLLLLLTNLFGPGGTDMPERPLGPPDIGEEAAAGGGAGPENASLICHPRLLDGCVERAVFLDAGVGLFENGLPDRPITMAHPSDFEAPTREVSSCETFVPLAAAGWGGLTSADMRREPTFRAICGLERLIASSQTVGQAPPLDSVVWSRLDRGSVPSIGEAGFTQGARMQDAGDRTVTLEQDGFVAKLTYITTANFDADPQPEHLCEWSVRAEEGTAFASGFGLIELTADSRAELRVIDPFADVEGGSAGQ